MRFLSAIPARRVAWIVLVPSFLAACGGGGGGNDGTTPVVTPAIADQPDAITQTTVARRASIEVRATGGSLAYQWFKGGTRGETASATTGGTPVAGQTDSSLDFEDPRTGDAGNYYVRVTNSAGVVYSVVVSLEVTSGGSSVIVN